MFSIQTDTFAGTFRYRLTNQDTGESLFVLPEYGGVLQQLVLRADGGLHSVIDGVTEEDLPGNIWRKSSLLFPFPGRVKDGTYTFGGRAYQLPINEPLRNTTLHGLVADAPFAVARAENTQDAVSIELAHEYDGRVAGYPFPFVLRVMYTLTREGLFRLDVQAQNTGSEAMPMGFGWHPYFKLGSLADQLRLTLPAHRFFELDATLVPTGKTELLQGFGPETAVQGGTLIGATHFDHGFVIETNETQAQTLLRDDSSNLALLVEQNVSEGFRYVQVYTPPHRNSIAIEPQTCMGDAFNNGLGLMTLQPGEMWQGSIGVRSEFRSQSSEDQ